MTLDEAKEVAWSMRHLDGATLYVSPQDLEDFSDEVWNANPLNKGPRPRTPWGTIVTMYGVQIRSTLCLKSTA